MKNLQHVHLIPLLLACLLTGCAASKSLKMADEALAAGDYYRAAKTYLTLMNGPKKGDAAKQLSSIAEQAYNMKKDQAMGLKDQGQYERAIPELKELNGFITSLRNYDLLNFSVINVDQTIRETSSAAAERYYTQAESNLENQNFTAAISNYGKVLQFDASFKDARNKLAVSHYSAGVQAERRGQFRGAITQYSAAEKTRSGFRDARDRVGQIHYHLGAYFLDEGSCRQAYEEFQRAASFGAAGANAKQSEAMECGTIKIAFVEFENKTERTIAGMDLGDVIFEKIRTKTQAKASNFVRMMDRQQLTVLLREQDINAGLLREGSSLPNTVQGVDFLVFGKINQLQAKHQEPVSTAKQDEYEVSNKVTYTDENGKKKTKTVKQKHPLVYHLVEESMRINMGGAITAVNARSGEIAITYQIDERSADEVKFVKGYQAKHDINDKSIKISRELLSYNKARKDLKEPEVLVDDIIEGVANQMTDIILAQLDRTSTIPDPNTIALEAPEL